ncbi:MAG: hypothetical protein QF805_10295, partial [Pirellulaceae bacterium]|nr:hypothetical protein [Pirellulaceae bacterium]
FASYGKGVAMSGPNCLVVEFGASYNLPKESCERADRRAKIEAALASVCGGPVKVQFQLSATPTPNTAERKPPPNRRQMMRDKEKHPLVSEAIEIFDAEMIRLDKSRPRPAASEGEGE